MEIISTHESIKDLERYLLLLAKTVGVPHRRVQFEPFYDVKNRGVDSVGGAQNQILLLGNKVAAPGVLLSNASIQEEVWYLCNVRLAAYMLNIGTGPSKRSVSTVSFVNNNVNMFPIVPVCANAVTANEFGALDDEFPGFFDGQKMFFQELYAITQDSGGTGAHLSVDYMIDGVRAIFS